MEHSSSNSSTGLSLCQQGEVDGDTIPPEWINRLFSFMHEKYGLMWEKFINTNSKSEQQLKDAWFRDLKYTTKPIFLRAIETIKTSSNYKDHMPHLNAMLWLCRPTLEDMGLPSEDEALTLFLHGRHREEPAVYHAKIRIHDSSARFLPKRVAKKIFLEQYNWVANKIREGDKSYLEINEPKALPSKPRDPEELVRCMKKFEGYNRNSSMKHISKLLHGAMNLNTENQQEGVPA